MRADTICRRRSSHCGRPPHSPTPAPSTTPTTQRLPAQGPRPCNRPAQPLASPGTAPEYGRLLLDCARPKPVWTSDHPCHGGAARHNDAAKFLQCIPGCPIPHNHSSAKEGASGPSSALTVPLPNTTKNANANPTQRNPGPVPLFVRMEEGRTLALNAQPSQVQVGDIKAQICNREGIPPAHQRLEFAGKPLLQDSRTLADYGVGVHSTMELLGRLRDGMPEPMGTETQQGHPQPGSAATHMSAVYQPSPILSSPPPGPQHPEMNIAVHAGTPTPPGAAPPPSWGRSHNSLLHPHGPGMPTSHPAVERPNTVTAPAKGHHGTPTGSALFAEPSASPPGPHPTAHAKPMRTPADPSLDSTPQRQSKAARTADGNEAQPQICTLRERGISGRLNGA